MKRSLIAVYLGIILGAAAFADAGVASPGRGGGRTGDPFAGMEGRGLSSVAELAAITGARPEPYYYEEAEERAEDPDREEMRHFIHAKAVSRRLVTQYDLRDCKVKDWNQACKFLTLVSGPQIDSGNIWTEAETIEVIKYMQKRGWINKDFFVNNPDNVVNYAANICGFKGGACEYSSSQDYCVRYLEIYGITKSHNPHFNLANIDGVFLWDPYSGQEDRIISRMNKKRIQFD